MGIVSKYIDNRIMRKLDELNLADRDQMSPVLFDEQWRMSRNRVFFYGDTPEILRFFKTRYPKEYMFETQNFYRVVKDNMPILHYPLARIISKTMVNLLFSQTPIVTVHTGNKSKDIKLQKDIYKLEKESYIADLLQKACQFESYSGVVAFKPIFDQEFSEYPFFVPYPKEDVEVVKKYDRVTEIIFKDIYEKNKEYYYLYTICGRGYIDYKLYHGIKKKNGMNEVSLTSLEETSELKRIDFRTKDGKQLDLMLAVYKENDVSGRSDYDNLYDDFYALDEIYSNMINYIRKSKIKTYLPENVLKVDTKDGKPVIPTDYDTDNIILYDSNPQGTEREIKRDVIEINESIIGYKETFNNTLLNALSTVGLSPATVGIDTAGANSSALALNIRERASLRTRAEKAKRWCVAIEDMFKLLLTLKTIQMSNDVAYVEKFDYDIHVELCEYSTPTFDEQVDSLGNALDHNLIDLDTALKMLYPNKTDEEVELMKIQIEGQIKTPEDIVNEEIMKNDTNIE